MALEGVPWDILIGGLIGCLIIEKIILPIIRIYYKYKSVKAPTLLEARKGHTKELKEFLKEWHDKLPLHKNATDPEINEHLNDFPKIEENWEYEDLIQYHLPKECKTLPKEWERYKKSIREYEKLKHQLYEKIKEDAIKKTNLEYDPNLNREHTISQHFVRYIYEQSVSWIRDRQLSYDKKFSDYEIEENVLQFGAYGLAKGSKEEVEKAKEIFERMMFDREYLEKYKQKINEIIEYERKLEEIYRKLEEMIEKLMKYSLLPGTKCEILRV